VFLACCGMACWRVGACVRRNDAAQAKRNGRASAPLTIVGSEGELAVDGNDGALMNTPRATAGA
jgi:hypothetical protein